MSSAGTPQTPKPMGDETLVQVITPAGAHAGSFLWPTSQLDHLKRINSTPFGYYLTWNADNDVSKPTIVHNLEAKT